MVPLCGFIRRLYYKNALMFRNYLCYIRVKFMQELIDNLKFEL